MSETAKIADTAPTTVAIVDDDERLVAALVRDLGSRGLQVHTAQSAQLALKLLEQYDVDVMLTDLRMSGRDGIDLIRAVGVLSPNTRSILMSAFATAKDYKVAMELGAVEVLGKPFTPDELHAALDKAIGWDGGVRGDMQGISLTDVLTVFHSGKRSVTIRLGGTASAIHMREGEIVHVEHGRLSGKDALSALLSAPLGRVRTGNLESAEQTIRLPFQSLLDEMVETLQKQRRTREVPVVDPKGVVRGKEVGKMSGPANKPSVSTSPPSSKSESSSRTMPLIVAGVVLLAAGILLFALGLQKGSGDDPAAAQSAAVRQINIDVSKWLQPAEPAEPARQQQLAAGAGDPTPEPGAATEQPAAEPAVVATPAEPAPTKQATANTAVASRKRTVRRRRRRGTTRPAPQPEPAPVVAVAPPPEPAPEPAPRKPTIGTIAAKQPAIGAVRSSKPVIGTVSR